MQKTNTLQKILLVLMGAVLLALPLPAGAEAIKNVIVLIPDGTGTAAFTIARWYKGAPLAIDSMDIGGAVRTYAANSLITDSAPAATAFATGHKTDNGFIGILPESVTMPGLLPVPEQQRCRPVASVLEAAKLSGRSVGMVATANIQHATSASYSSHWHDRNNYQEIAEQQVHLGLDVVFGGGRTYLLPKDKGGVRTDGEDLVETLKSRGYALVETREEMLATAQPKAWGLFAEDALAYDLDRRASGLGKEPSLAEMTRKAITLLARNPRGFFLLVEGSKVDWSAHANDPVGVVSEVLAFDEAVGEALAFAEKREDTLILAFTDHGNGGLSLGNKGSAAGYATLPLEAMIGPLKRARITAEGVARMLDQDSSEDTIARVLADYGIEDLTTEEMVQIQQAPKGRLHQVVGPLLSRRTAIGWTTSGHTGEDVILYSHGIKPIAGLLENTRIAHLCATAMGVDLDLANARLFVEAQEAFASLGASVRIEQTAGERLVLVVEKEGVTGRLPLSKDFMRVIPAQGQSRPVEAEFSLGGLTVLAEKTGKVYVPQQALFLFRSYLANE